MNPSPLDMASSAAEPIPSKRNVDEPRMMRPGLATIARLLGEAAAREWSALANDVVKPLTDTEE